MNTNSSTEISTCWKFIFPVEFYIIKGKWYIKLRIFIIFSILLRFLKFDYNGSKLSLFFSSKSITDEKVLKVGKISYMHLVFFFLFLKCPYIFYALEPSLSRVKYWNFIYKWRMRSEENDKMCSLENQIH